MSRTVTPAQRQAEIDAVKTVMEDQEWLRPSTIASLANLKTAVVLSALRALDADRQEFLIPRLHHGADRVRKTSRLVVEYRLRSAVDFSSFPPFLLTCPPKEPSCPPRNA